MTYEGESHSSRERLPTFLLLSRVVLPLKKRRKGKKTRLKRKRKTERKYCMRCDAIFLCIKLRSIKLEWWISSKDLITSSTILYTLCLCRGTCNLLGKCTYVYIIRTYIHLYPRVELISNFVQLKCFDEAFAYRY